ncbi:MAG: Trm112 family protein [Epsilonproteobacteria bacterium]|nr:Trm112 family protein [Campylobacterota bacterium]
MDSSIKEILSVLACPKCKGCLITENERLVCTNCGLKYEIEDGIPRLIIDEAEDKQK